jgi:anti-sigma regulatory factor (Ser/Thr protein kinase)
MNIVSEHRLRNDPGEARQVGAWVQAFAHEAGLSAEVQNALDLSLVEWVTNIISYAYEDGCEHSITLRFKAGVAEVCVEVEDDGKEFNPLLHPPADINAPLETRPIGGLGIHMMRKLVDAVEYRRANGRNIVTLRKRVA